MADITGPKVDAAYSMALVGALLASGIPPHGISWLLGEIADWPAPVYARGAVDFLQSARNLYDDQFGDGHG